MTMTVQVDKLKTAADSLGYASGHNIYGSSEGSDRIHMINKACKNISGFECEGITCRNEDGGHAYALNFKKSAGILRKDETADGANIEILITGPDENKLGGTVTITGESMEALNLVRKLNRQLRWEELKHEADPRVFVHKSPNPETKTVEKMLVHFAHAVRSVKRTAKEIKELSATQIVGCIGGLAACSGLLVRQEDGYVPAGYVALAGGIVLIASFVALCIEDFEMHACCCR
jgi:hypothetical protein